MAVLTVATVTRAGVDVVGVEPAGGGDTFANTGYEFVEVNNASGSSITVTLDITKTVDGAAVTDPTVTVADGVTKIIGPFPTSLYNDSNSRVKVTCSATTGVTVKALKCSPA